MSYNDIYYHNPQLISSTAITQKLQNSSDLHVPSDIHSFTVQSLTWQNMKCWTTEPFCPRQLLSPSLRPLHPLWRPSPPHPPHPHRLPHLLHLLLPLRQLQSSLRRWGKEHRQHRALHSSGWLRERLLRYTALSAWLLSCCLILTAPWEWWFTHWFTNFSCRVAKWIITAQYLCKCGESCWWHFCTDALTFSGISSECVIAVVPFVWKYGMGNIQTWLPVYFTQQNNLWNISLECSFKDQITFRLVCQ